MADLDQRQRERTGLHPGQVQGHVAEAGATDGPQNVSTQGIHSDPGKIGDRQLEPGDVPVMAYPKITETEIVQGLLGSIDLAQLLRA